MEKILERFLRYVSVDTKADPESETQPSAARELDLLQMLRDELIAMGVEATLDEYGYVMATIPANCEKADVPAIGFIAHVDTAPDASGANIKPQIIENYDGGEIALKGVPGLYLKPSDFPEMLQYVGQTLITTDGTTLLGADDKAGIAEIMDAVQYIVEHPEFKHGEIKIGGSVGELEYENFNAAGATITIQGCNVHPGTAKGKMRNASLIAMELHGLLPVEQRPEYTCGYEGFFHLISFKGEVETATFSYIIRDHDMQLFEEKKALIQKCVDFINAKYGEGTAVLELKHQYYNMRKEVEPHYHIVETAMKAMELEGIKPKIQPIRGGTDGANLSFMGLPCPNIFAGGHNFHGKMEYVPLESMQKASNVILNIIKLYAE